jgi:SRSO17 transposase
MTERLTVAGVPDDVGFATKPALAQSLITEAVNASVPASWVAWDEDPRAACRPG